jgi:hypothetical protein
VQVTRLIVNSVLLLFRALYVRGDLDFIG